MMGAIHTTAAGGWTWIYGPNQRLAIGGPALVGTIHVALAVDPGYMDPIRDQPEQVIGVEAVEVIVNV